MPRAIGSFHLVLLALILIISGALMLSAAATDSATFDESAHIPAGYSYVRYFDYRLNHEHPPVVKALAGIPLLFMDLTFPEDSDAWTKDVNGQWRVGAQFLYEYGNDSGRIIFWSRVGPIFLTLLTIAFVYIFALRVLSRTWALLPAFLFALSPTVLAHGHYVTTDIGAALGVLLALYFFLNYLEQPAGRTIVFAGLAFGAAQLLKFSNILLIPLFCGLVFLLIAFDFFEYRRDGGDFGRFAKAALRRLRELALIFAVGTILIYLIYAIFTWNYPPETQVRDMETVLRGFRAKAIKDAAIWMASNPVLQPLAQYLFGVFSVLQRTAGGNAAYFLGELAGKGWWYYFPVVYLLKEPLPVLLLLSLSLFLALKRAGLAFANVFGFLKSRLPETAMAGFALFYWVNSMASPLNIGMRHIIPTLPLIYILATQSLSKWLALPFFSADTMGKAISFLLALPKIFLRTAMIFILLLWFALEVLIVSPHYISYFSELGGGTARGYRYVTDSNYDWGQDLYRLHEFTERKGIRKIAVDYFGGGSPHSTLGEKYEGWWSSRGNPKDLGIEWLAVSANTLSGALAKLTPGFERKAEDEYRWLQEMRDPWLPDARAGYSIFIFKL